MNNRSQATPQNVEEDALVLVHLRNLFFKEKFYVALGLYCLSLLVILLLSGILLYLVKKPMVPLYFMTDSIGRLVPDLPLTAPNMSTDAVSDWVTEAVEAAYSYDFVNYHQQLQSAERYFSDYGWRTYMDGLKASNNLLALNQRKLVIVANVIAKPKLVHEGLLGGHVYAWKFEVPVLVTYYPPPYDDASKFQNPLIVSIIVRRERLVASYKGLSVVQMIGNFVTTSAPQQLSPTPAAQ